MLGKALSPDGKMSVELEKRCLRGKEEAERLCCPIIVTGGKRHPSIPVTEAAVMKDFLTAQGFCGGITAEESSRVTKQNAINCAPLVADYDRIYLCSSASHFKRIYMRPIAYFKKYTGKEIIPCPVEGY